MNNFNPECLNFEQLRDKQLQAIDVVCVGHFNVLHPGHVRYLDFASKLGSNLCVVLRGDADLSDEEAKHFFPEAQRAHSLRSLESVDLVVTSGSKTLSECLQKIAPRILVLGNEHKDSADKHVHSALSALKTSSTKVIYHSGEQANITWGFDSVSVDTKSIAAREKFVAVCEQHGVSDEKLITILNRFEAIESLVVGDLIVDNFVSCQAVGLSSEAPVVVVKEIESNKFVGGGGVVAAHITSLGAKSSFVSTVGHDEVGEYAATSLQESGVSEYLIRDQLRPTTFKTRYMVETQKLFRVSRLEDQNISGEVEDKLIEKIQEIGPKCSNIIVSDFVYGVVTPRVLEAVVSLAKQHGVPLFGDLQCSSQVGSILKFKNFSMIFPTEKEARIAVNAKDSGLEYVARQILQRSNCDNLAITLGANGVIMYVTGRDNYVSNVHLPALSVHPVDVAGAGDSMLASMSSAISSGASPVEAAALGSIVAACAIETMGNTPINKTRVIERILKTFN